LGEKQRVAIKRLLLAAGGKTPSSILRCYGLTAAWIEMGRWMRDRFGSPTSHLATREEIFDLVGRDVAEKRVLYLEFGVYRGESIKYWSQLLRNPASALHGFDSFEGLPESWNEDTPKGRFSTAGQVPDVSDRRVEFFVGWFEDTLPRYVPPPHDILVINIDADLYSSAKFVLQQLKSMISVGTWIYFDEFFTAQHEFRAFREFVEDTGIQFEAVAESNCSGIAFRRIA